MFTIHAEIEDSLCKVPIGRKIDKSKPLGLLQQLLGISYMKGPRAYTFALAILKAYTNSRYEQIVWHLVRGELPPEPEEQMDKVLLSVVDRGLVFMFTQQPLHCLPVSSPHFRLEHHRLKLEMLLSDKTKADRLFSAFTMLVPQVNQKELLKPWHIRPWLQERGLLGKKLELLRHADADANEIMWPTVDKDILFAGFNGAYINLRTLDMAVTTPEGPNVWGGLHIHKLGIRLACNYISSTPAPKAVHRFVDAIFTSIERFAKDLEECLEAHKPNWVGEHRDANQDDVDRVTMLMGPSGAHKVLQIGIELVLSTLGSESFGLAQWFWIATEVQQGKAAVQNAYEEWLVKGLHYGSNPDS